jgi:hypothetical protein
VASAMSALCQKPTSRELFETSRELFELTKEAPGWGDNHA